MGWRTRQLPENVSLVYRFQFILIWTGRGFVRKKSNVTIYESSFRSMRFRSNDLNVKTLSLAQV